MTRRGIEREISHPEAGLQLRVGLVDARGVQKDLLGPAQEDGHGASRTETERVHTGMLKFFEKNHSLQMRCINMYPHSKLQSCVQTSRNWKVDRLEAEMVGFGRKHFGEAVSQPSKITTLITPRMRRVASSFGGRYRHAATRGAPSDRQDARSRGPTLHARSWALAAPGGLPRQAERTKSMTRVARHADGIRHGLLDTYYNILIIR